MELITFILGAIGGFVVHSLSMKVSFKQRTIDNKVKVYDAIIGHWVRMRNIIYSVHPDITGEPVPPGTERDFDRIYGESQQLIGEAILICEDKSLTEDINTLNEKLYRTRWGQFNLDEANKEIEIIKKEAFEIIERMREDIKSNTILHWSDFVHIFSGLKKSA
ncbi:hypothetical protein [Microbulbifer thermotolerans]|uniref:hypothetical protein n=1 Tax=Microbulbifer thermotolerans TaxID=252514 RepID=UPI0022494857|nr:hypothetical protein [Microbulbifer thermotolerans]MCX2833076.1 hypothetical protein [Microbulbifer thermotolerans]